MGIETLEVSRKEKDKKLQKLNDQLLEAISQRKALKKEVDENKDEKKRVDELIRLEGEKYKIITAKEALKDRIKQSFIMQWFVLLIKDLKEKRNKLASDDIKK